MSGCHSDAGRLFHSLCYVVVAVVKLWHCRWWILHVGIYCIIVQ